MFQVAAACAVPWLGEVVLDFLEVGDTASLSLSPLPSLPRLAFVPSAVVLDFLEVGNVSRLTDDWPRTVLCVHSLLRAQHLHPSSPSLNLDCETLLSALVGTAV